MPRFSAISVLVWALAPNAHSMANPSDSFVESRRRMVDEEIVASGVEHAQVIASMRKTPRHEFVPVRVRPNAYYDMALPIGKGQTISPPFVVAYMTEQIDPQPTDHVLEIGTGSGYQAAVLSPLVREVYTIEIVESLGRRATRTLQRLGYANVHVKIGDGYQGWPEQSPFDKIIVTCSPDKVPAALVEQLREGGTMIVPVGERYQQVLYLFTKIEGRLESKALRPTLFVPMTGTAEELRKVQPDPRHPRLVNGNFEQSKEGSDGLFGWHYARQSQRVADTVESPDGDHYVTFTNDVPGRGSQILQGFAIDGRSIAELNVSLWVKSRDIGPGQAPAERPRLVIMFYDSNRGPAGHAAVGPWNGSFDWREVSARLPVPLSAREAIVRVGLLGAVGQVSIDNLRLAPVLN